MPPLALYYYLGVDGLGFIGRLGAKVKMVERLPEAD